MREFETYLSEEAIVAYLCKLRAKVAKSRNKKHLIHLLTDSDKYNYHLNDSDKYSLEKPGFPNEFSKYQAELLAELSNLLPSRKHWITLGRFSRTNNKTKQPISSNDRNFYSLVKTIKKFRKTLPNEPWLKALDAFILDIQTTVLNGSYKVAPPVVYPKLKEELSKTEKNKCRPISLFPLKDRVILSLTNRFLTQLFDRYFEDCSYAFRSKKNKENTAVLTHHDCIKDIKKYTKAKEGETLWIVECDMEKFYDSVNHNIIIQLFHRLIEKAKKDYPNLDLCRPSIIFDQFLNSYSFNKNVLPLNHSQEYWEKYKIPNGEFGWVLNQIKKLGYYDNIDNENIGVPQGGALSCLVANIVLDVADKEVLKTNVFYIRFCDDMLILHPKKGVCTGAKRVYIGALRELKLVPHKFCKELIVNREKIKKDLPETSIVPFWNKKSKGPYKWGSIADGGFPWLGFVGY